MRATLPARSLAMPAFLFRTACALAWVGFAAGASAASAPAPVLADCNRAEHAQVLQPVLPGTAPFLARARAVWVDAQRLRWPGVSAAPGQRFRLLHAADGMDDHTLLALLAGTVGESAARMISAVRATYLKLITSEAIQAAPSTAPVPTAVSIASRRALRTATENWIAMSYLKKVKPRARSRRAQCAKGLRRSWPGQNRTRSGSERPI
jgi:hypothetical protein